MRMYLKMMRTYVSFVTGTMEENPPAAKKPKFCLMEHCDKIEC